MHLRRAAQILQLAGGRRPCLELQAPVDRLPFLYPPFVLPFLGPLALLPRAVAIVGWMLIGVIVAAWTCKRLGIQKVVGPPGPYWLAAVAARGSIGGAQCLFAAFLGLMLDSPRADRPFQPVERDLATSSRPAWVDGFLAVVNGAIKPSQAQPWLLAAGVARLPRFSGAGIVIALVIATLPITGLSIWFDWVAQLNRATDPDWAFRGAGLAAGLPPFVGLSLAAATMAAAVALPRRFAAPWLGILMIVGNPSLRMFGLLTLLPGMLTVRREIGLVAALGIASYTLTGLWLGVALVSAALAAATRWPGWLEGGVADLSQTRRVSGVADRT